MMNIKELEAAVGIKEEDKVDCPYGDCYDTCLQGLDHESCVELYEQFLIETATEE